MGLLRKRRILKWLPLLTGGLALLVLATTVGVGLAARQFQDSGRIAPNVRVEGVLVGNATNAEATRLVLDQWAAKLPGEVALRWPGGIHKVAPDKLGAQRRIAAAIARAQQVGREGGVIRQVLTRMRLSHRGINVPVSTDVERRTLHAYLVALANRVNRQPRNADVEVSGDEVKVVPGVAGLAIDVEAGARALATALKTPSLDVFQLPVKPLPPTISAADLQHLETVLATYTTHFRTWQKDRTHNLELAIKSLSRAVLMPGDTLSFNDRVGPRLLERGFREAPIFVDGEIEPATGGGVCQVASTVYNAALLANLDVTERHHHSRPVTYTPSGRDATVYWGQCDLRFRNTLKHPILVLGAIDDDAIIVRILGSREDKWEVEIVRSGVASVAHGTQEVPDPNLEAGKREVDKPGRDGARVSVSRVVKRGGKTVKREALHTDTYPAQTRVVRVGAMAPGNVEDAEMEALAAAGLLPPGPATTKPGTTAQPGPAPKPGTTAKPGPAPKPGAAAARAGKPPAPARAGQSAKPAPVARPKATKPTPPAKRRPARPTAPHPPAP